MKIPRSNTLAAAFAISMVLLLLWRLGVIKYTGRPPYVSQAQYEVHQAGEALAESLLDGLTIVTADELSAEGVLETAVGTELRADLQAADWTGASKPAVMAAGEAIDDLLGLITNRWLGGDFESYDRFFRERGYRRKSREDLSHLAWTYENASGEPLTDDVDADTFLATVWAAPTIAKKSMNKLRGISTDPSALEVVVGRYCPGQVPAWPVLAGELGEDLWKGGSAGSFSRIYEEPGDHWYDRRNAGECFESMNVGLIMVFENDIRVPISMLFWFDDRAGRWWLMSISMSNAPGGFGGIIF